MRATIMYKAGDVRIDNVPDATITEPTDAVIRMSRACIRRADLRWDASFAGGVLWDHLSRWRSCPGARVYRDLDARHTQRTHPARSSIRSHDRPRGSPRGVPVHEYAPIPENHDQALSIPSANFGPPSQRESFPGRIDAGRQERTGPTMSLPGQFRRNIRIDAQGHGLLLAGETIVVAPVSAAGRCNQKI